MPGRVEWDSAPLSRKFWIFMKPGQIACVCGKAHWPKQAYLHLTCVVNTNSDVVNKLEPAGRCDEGVSLPKGGMKALVEEIKRQTKWQQDNRDRYNKKMREYMKRKRSGFIGVPYG